jgi:ribonuclease D
MTNFLYKNDLPADVDFGTSIAIDSETMGLITRRDRLCVVQISGGDGNAHLVHFDGFDYSAPNLKKLLSNEFVLKIFHFARFDIAALNYYLNLDVQNIYCTKIASKLVRTYTDSHGLKNICDELLNVEISKKQQLSDWGNSQINAAQIKYAAQDVLYLHGLKEKLDAMLNRENRKEIFDECMKFLPTRAKLDIIGFENVDIFAHM